jgi:hypothetical protein
MLFICCCFKFLELLTVTIVHARAYATQQLGQQATTSASLLLFAAFLLLRLLLLSLLLMVTHSSIRVNFPLFQG